MPILTDPQVATHKSCWLRLADVRIPVVDFGVFVPSQRPLHMTAQFCIRRMPQVVPAFPNTPTLTPLHAEAWLVFGLEPGRQPRAAVKLACSTTQVAITPSTVIEFESHLKPSDVDFVSSQRSGQDVYIGWRFMLTGLLSTPNSQVFTTSITEEAKYPDDYLQVSPQQFKDKFLVPSGLCDRVVVEVPVTGIDQELVDKIPLELAGLCDSLEMARKDLLEAMTGLSSAKTLSDYDGVMAKVRSSVDRLKAELNKGTTKTTLAKCAYVDAHRASGEGAQEAAEDVIGGILKVLDGLFDICSKSPHGNSKAKRKYTMRFDAHDASMAIGLCAQTVGQIQRRIEHYVVACG